MRHNKTLRLRSLCNDIADADLRIILPVALGALVLLLALELKDEDLVGLVVGGNRGVHAGVRSAIAREQFAGFAVFKNRQNFAESDLGSGVAAQFWNAHHVARRDAELLSARFDNCVHGISETSLFLCAFAGFRRVSGFADGKLARTKSGRADAKTLIIIHEA